MLTAVQRFVLSRRFHFLEIVRFKLRSNALDRRHGRADWERKTVMLWIFFSARTKTLELESINHFGDGLSCAQISQHLDSPGCSGVSFRSVLSAVRTPNSWGFTYQYHCRLRIPGTARRACTLNGLPFWTTPSRRRYGNR